MRKILFWMHLAAGLTAGTIVLIMSVTGVALTYEKQWIRWADGRALGTQPQGTAPIPVEELLARVRDQRGGLPSSVTWRNGLSEPVLMSYGRESMAYVDGATGIVLGEGSKGTRGFFRTMTDWHRWLGQDGEGRAAGRAITGACNLAFLFMVLSGLYLWFPRGFPREWARRHFAPIVWFRGGLSGKAREFNWHNTIGFWCLVPLFFVVVSGVVMSYPWANELVYTLTGSEAPAVQAKGGEGRKGGGEGRKGREAKQRGGKKGEGRAQGGPVGGFALPPADLPLEGLNVGWERARGARRSWESITLSLPANGSAPVVFTVDEAGPGRADLRSTVTVRRDTGEVKVASEYESYNAGRRARTWLRFAHTGEVYGIVGQTIAGLASLGAVFLVYTGVALSLRRLAGWRRRRGRAVKEQAEVVAA